MPAMRGAERSLAVEAWVFLLALASLLLELLLVRIFDTIVGASAAYTIVTTAVLGSGLAGCAAALRPGWLTRVSGSRGRFGVALACAASLGIVHAAIQLLPFSVDRIPDEPAVQLPAFAALHIALLIPFFLTGLGIASALAANPGTSARIYGVDLVGAAIGAVVVSPLLPGMGPVGVLGCASAAYLLAAGSTLILESRSHRARDSKMLGLATMAVAAVLLVGSVAGLFRPLDYAPHSTKRGARETALRQQAEFRVWDPISKIEVVDVTERDPNGRIVPGTERKLISYDGGSQSSHIYPFDGDFARLRASLPDSVVEHFWQRGVLAGHYLLRNESPRTLVVGAAGGQDVKAALVYDAGHVDAIDLVGTLIDLGKNRYAAYNGRLFHDPRVDFFQGEARSYLARNREPYDLIQIFSYHNSARLAAGAGAIKAFYLQTAEWYELCLRNLSPDGMVQVNQAFYPRVLTTLGETWRRLGWAALDQHVVVYERDGVDDHATILIRRRPWTAADLADLDALLLADVPSEGRRYRRVVDPLDAGRSDIPAVLYRTETDPKLQAELRAIAPYRLDPVTDDRPFAFFLRKGLGRLEPDSSRFLPPSTATLLNWQSFGRLPLTRDASQMAVTATIALLLLAAAALLPLRFGSVGRAKWKGRGATLAYFGFLGAGFLLIELVLLQLALQLVGRPIQAYATAIGSLLVFAGLGSMASANSRSMVTSPSDSRSTWSRWLRRPLRRPFLSLLIAGCAFWLLYPWLWRVLAPSSLGVRMLAVGLAYAPLGFFLGMPFPRGLQHLTELRFPSSVNNGHVAAVAWAWAMNSIASVVGGLGSAILSIHFGFRVTLLVGAALYVGAALMFALMRSGVRSTSPDRDPSGA